MMVSSNTMLNTSKTWFRMRLEASWLFRHQVRLMEVTANNILTVLTLEQGQSTRKLTLKLVQ